MHDETSYPSFIIPFTVSRVAEVRKQLKVESSSVGIFENITTSNLEIAGEIYIALIFSLNKYSDHFSNTWCMFYKDLFENNSPSQIILTLNRMMKRNDRVKGRRQMTNSNNN